MQTSQTGYRKIVASALLGGVLSITLAACHKDKVESDSGGGTVRTTRPAAQPQPTQGAIRPTQDTRTQQQTQQTQAARCDGFPSGSGMIWKPVSEGDGRLVVLLPSSYAESTGVAVADRNGNIIERVPFGPRTNGNRPTYRFSRSGGGYPSPAILVVGSSQRFCIPNTGSRYD